MDDTGSRVPAAAKRIGRVRHVTSVCWKKWDSMEPRPRLGRAEAALLAQAKRGVDCLTYHCGLLACRSVVSALEIDVPAWRRVGGKTPPSLVGHQSDPGKSRILQNRCDNRTEAVASCSFAKALSPSLMRKTLLRLHCFMAPHGCVPCSVRSQS